MPDGFGIFLQRLLDDRGLSAPELARLMGRTERSIYYWLRETRTPRDAVALLASALDISPADMRLAVAGERPLPPQCIAANRLGGHEAGLREAPAFGKKGTDSELTRILEAGRKSRCAGSPSNYERADAKVDDVLPAYESVPAGPLGACDVERLSRGVDESGRFRVRVRGQSMAPDYPDGCWVVFSRPRALAEGLVDDRDYLVWTNGQESTFKRLSRDPADPWQYLLLRPLNPDRREFLDVRLHRGEVAYIARAVRKEIDLP